jgi:N-acetylmuramoyl-L-alanine amidase
MKVRNIILDPGHGGIDSSGRYTTAPDKMFKHDNGEVAYEGKINREISKHLYDFLIDCSTCRVLFTVRPEDPKDVPLYKRVSFSNDYNENETIYISIHCNASPSHNATGFEIFTTEGETESDFLAEDIADSVEGLYKEMSLKLRYDLSDGDKDKEASFKVIRETNCPAVLLEILFFDNYSDFLKLRDVSFQKKVAEKIGQGVINYIDGRS